MPYDLPDWLSSKIIPEPNSGCWLWEAACSDDGYGRVRLGRHKGKAINYPAHRLVYEFYCGPVADEEVMDHLCRLHCCVNPEHQEPTTHQINILRGTGASARQARKTHCDNGHPLEDAYRVNGWRKCRPCQLENMRRYYQRKKKAANASS